MNEQNMNFPIPNAVLEPYIKAAVSASIAAALGDGVKIIEVAVQSALMKKVDERGKVNDSSYHNKYNIMDIIATESIQKIARETIQEMAEEMRPEIRAQIQKHIKSKSGEIAGTLVNGLMDSLKSEWNIKVIVDPQKK